jgi:hypothetical protein
MLLIVHIEINTNQNCIPFESMCKLFFTFFVVLKIYRGKSNVREKRKGDTKANAIHSNDTHNIDGSKEKEKL